MNNEASLLIDPVLTAPRKAASQREDIGAGFSFGAAMSALEERASLSLEVHGAAPKNAQPGARAPAGETSPAQNQAVADTPHTPQTREQAPERRAEPQTPQSNPAAPLPPAPPPAAAIQIQAQQISAAQAGTPLPGAAAATVQSAARSDASAIRTGDILKTAPRKADSALPLQKEPPVTQSDFSKILARKLDVGATQFELRLDPPSLGKVEANMTLSDDGENILALKFENQSTMDLFARDESALRAALTSSGHEFSREHIVLSLAEMDAGSSDSHEFDAFSSYEPLFMAPWSRGVIDIRA